MASGPIHVEEKGGALWLTLDRPPVNVLDLATIRELQAAIAPLTRRRDVKALVLRSAIGGTFSAGVDVLDHAKASAVEMLETFHTLIRLVDALPQATIAAVDGLCLGGGCELVAICDFVLATPRSAFGQPEIDVGCFPPVAAALLPRFMGRRAFDMILLGSRLRAEEAAAAGLVSRVVPDVNHEADVLVERLAAKSAVVLALARRAVRRGGDGGLLEAIARNEALYRDELLSTEDVEEGVRSFLEKREPRWGDK